MFGATLVSPVLAQDKNLPPLADVLDKVLEKARQEHVNDQEFKAQYGYLRTRTTRELDSKGQVKKQTTKQWRNNPPAVVPTSYVRPAPSPVGSLSRANDLQTPRAGEGKAFDKNDFFLNDDLLSRFEFTLIKREPVRGRDALLVHFKPANKKLPTRGLKDRVINKAAGTVWIDEEDFVLSKVDLHLTDGVNVVGGLVGAVKKFNYTCDRTRTPDGFWYADDIRWRLEGREIFSRKVMESEETRSEVKKVQ